MILTPFVAKFVGLDNPQSAMIYGGLMGTTSGTAAGMAAVDPKLVPYAAMTATFYTGSGCTGISVNSVFCNKSYFWLSNDPGRKQVQRCMITKLKN